VISTLGADSELMRRSKSAPHIGDSLPRPGFAKFDLCSFFSL
jgi:hypothetical protein